MTHPPTSYDPSRIGTLFYPDLVALASEAAQADLPARALPVPDAAERRSIIAEIARRGGTEAELEDRVARSPLVRVEFV